MDLVGKQLGPYRVTRFISSGGMGDVYVAEDTRDSQEVALKVIRSELALYPNAQSAQEATKLFEREVRAIGHLDHPHILPLKDYGEAQIGEQTFVYLVMPYCPDGSLAKWVQQHYADHLVPPEVVVHVVNQAAEALQHAHDQKVIHQDVKPANFLVRHQEEAPTQPSLLLADFGIARFQATSSGSSTSVRGSATYMAPERYRGKSAPASDQYALAVMAYELLTGRPPFQGRPDEVMHQHLNDAPEPPSARNAHLPGALDGVLGRARQSPPSAFRLCYGFCPGFSAGGRYDKGA